MEKLFTPALDGHPLATTHFIGENPDGPVVLISSGTAIPQQFYRRFAKWLARQGASLVITYDYRGIAGSWPDGNKRKFSYLMSDWARLDYPAMIDWAKREYPERELYTVGHSFGGQVFGLCDRNEKTDKSVLIASMSGHWARMDSPEKYKVWFMLSVLAPLLGTIYGYIPGRYGLGEDMSFAAFSQWARWCKNQNYFFDDPGLIETGNFANYKGPLLAIGMTDDPWGTPELIDHLATHFTGAQLERWEFSPDEAGEKIGHFGFFRHNFEKPLWEKVGAWLFA